MVRLGFTQDDLRALHIILGLCDPMALRAKNKKGQYMSEETMEKVCDQIHPLFDRIDEALGQV